MSRRSLTAVALTLMLSAVAAPAPAATTYQNVKLTVPVSADSMPIGTIVTILCNATTPTGVVSGQVDLPLQTQNGFGVYHGPPILVVIQQPAGSGKPSLVTGTKVTCGLLWSPQSNSDPTKSLISTSAVTLQ
jgi:hypothetical protein